MKMFSYLLYAGCLASAGAAYSSDCVAQMRLWGTYYGGIGGEDEESAKVAVDASGNVYVVGLTGSMSGIATPNGFDPILEKPSNQGFLAKFNSNGKLVWATYYGDGVSTKVSDVGLDGNGNVYIAGEITCPSHELPTPTAWDKFCEGPTDMFLAKFGPNGKRLWGTYYGGDEIESAGGISVMPSGDVYLIGTTTSTRGYIISRPSKDATLDGESDALVAKFNPQGGLIWSRYYGGNFDENGRDIACRWGPLVQERCYITGDTRSTEGIATQGAHDNVMGTSWEDAFVAQINGSNGQTIWSTYYGGDEESDIGKSAVVDKNFNVYVGGDTRSENAIASLNAHDTTHSELTDMFLVKFNIFGVRQAGTYYGNDDFDFLADLAIDGNDNVYVFGIVEKPGDFATPNAYDTVFSGENEVVIAKFGSALNRIWGTYYGGSKYEMWNGTGGITVDKNNRVYVTSNTRSTDAISTFGTHQPIMAGSDDVFLVKFGQ